MLLAMTAVIGRSVKVDVVRPSDRDAIERLFAACSLDTVIRRFCAPLRSLPRAYLEGALAGPPKVHDALAVRYGDGLHIAALGSVVALPDDPRAAELGVLVADGWQRSGLGAALVRELVARAVDRGVEELIASVLPARAGLLRVLARRLALIEVTGDSEFVTGRFRLPEEMPR